MDSGEETARPFTWSYVFGAAVIVQKHAEILDGQARVFPKQPSELTRLARSPRTLPAPFPAVEGLDREATGGES